MASSVVRSALGGAQAPGAQEGPQEPTGLGYLWGAAPSPRLLALPATALDTPRAPVSAEPPPLPGRPQRLPGGTDGLAEGGR